MMNHRHETSKFQSRTFLAAILSLLSFGIPAFAVAFQGQAEIEKRVDALTTQDIPALLQKAQSGDVTAQYMIGQAYYLGKGAATDYKEAVKWINKAAEQGYALAQYSLSIMYSKGEGVPANEEAALKWMHKAAEGGVAGAQFFWGYFIELSRQGDAEAAKWYRKSAEQGFAAAQTALGFFYEQGRGVGQDFRAAVNWYRKAAEQGNANAQSNLGNMYNAGTGVGQDFNEAAKWFRMSAEQGWPAGQASLAGIYMSGQGVPRDLVSAYMWCSLAATGGNRECAEGLKVLEANMKAEEVAEAKRRTLAWAQAHPNPVKALDQADDTQGQIKTGTAEAQGGGVASTDPARKNSAGEKLRARAVELAIALEGDPLSSKAKEYRKEMKKLMDNKELGVSLIICMPALGNDFFSKQEYSEELLSQFIYSQVRFGIEHPDKAQDVSSATIAGIEGVLHVYTAIKKLKPKVRSDSLEVLLQKQQSGSLNEYIKSRGC